jgi:hypothetical protein
VAGAEVEDAEQQMIDEVQRIEDARQAARVEAERIAAADRVHAERTQRSRIDDDI